MINSKVSRNNETPLVIPEQRMKLDRCKYNVNYS